MNEAQPKVVALDLSAVPDLEYSALKALTEGKKRQRELGVSTWLVGLNPGVLQMVQRSPLGKALGREKMHFSLELAVAKYLELSTKVTRTWWRSTKRSLAITHLLRTIRSMTSESYGFYPCSPTSEILGDRRPTLSREFESTLSRGAENS